MHWISFGCICKEAGKFCIVAILGQEWFLIYIPELHSIHYLSRKIWSERLLIDVKGPEDVQYLFAVAQPVNSLVHLCLWYFFGILNKKCLQLLYCAHSIYDLPLQPNCPFSVFLNQDGRIDYGEFVAMMTKGNMGVGRRTMRNSLNISMRDTPGALWSLNIQEICCSMRDNAWYRLRRASSNPFFHGFCLHFLVAISAEAL